MPVSVITGATSGLGRWIALGLASAGHRVVLIARTQARGESATAWIKARHPVAAADIVVADLSLLADTRQAAASIAAAHPAIHVLVNNAGIFSARREETAEGHERVLATNHLSPFVMTRALLPALQAAGGARIVNTGSSTADRARISPEDLELRTNWGMVRAYSQSKLALTMATIGWAERLRGTGITANIVHPGAVATSLVRERGAIGLAWRLMSPFMLTEEQGADSTLHVALSEEYGHINGAYVKRRRPVPPNRLAEDPALRAAVWNSTEALTAA
jgi:NAD(P)-dependent dehydrogenase (short-subunit alcohol dehydrogenase family)